MSKTRQSKTARRNFLRAGVVAGAGATVVAAVPGVALGSDESQEQTARQPENYRLTKHISDYYKSTL